MRRGCEECREGGRGNSKRKATELSSGVTIKERRSEGPRPVLERIGPCRAGARRGPDHPSRQEEGNNPKGWSFRLKSKKGGRGGAGRHTKGRAIA